MKKFYSFLFAAVALVGFAACNSDSTEEPAPAQQVGKMEFTANIGEDTKTQLGVTTDGKTEVLWCQDDKITVNGVSFEIKDKENYTPATTAKFVGGEVDGPYYYAVYGTTSTATDAFNLSLTSNLGIENIADGSNISVAYSENSTLAFKNVVTILKFEVAAACKSVKITSTAALEGDFTVTMDEDGNPVVATDSTDMEIELKGEFQTGIPYYTTILPGDHQFTVTIDGKPSKSASKAMTMNRNTIYNLKTLPVNYRVYVEDDSEYSNLYLYLFDDKGNNTWPGAQLTETVKINDVDYKYFDVPAEMVGKTYTYIFNNGEKSQVEEGKKLTFNKDNYLWLTKKYTQNIDASNKGKTDPYTIYALQWDWNDWTDICCYMWINGGATNATWPGKSMTAMGSKTKYNDKSYYYWEVTTDFDGKSNVNFIINGMKDGNRKQTNDIKNKSITKNYYVRLNGNDGGGNFTCQEKAF